MPISSKVKSLYLAKSVGELNKQAESKLPAVNDAGKSAKSADKLYKQANKVYEEGDEERAYILYFRFLSFYTNITKSANYMKQKEYCTAILGNSPNEAMNRAEQLQKHLSERYLLLQESKIISHLKEETESISVKTNAENKLGNEIDKNSIKGNEIEESPLNNSDQKSSLYTDNVEKTDNSTTSDKLYELLMLNSDVNLLILDIRSQSDYENSHIKHDSCINIPKEILRPGITAASLEKSLPQESISLWQKRGCADLVILLDLNGGSKNLKNIHHPLCTLHEAINKWDLSTVLKSNPLILEGGYEDWILHYPTMTTNPRIQITSNVIKPLIPEHKLEVEYPNLDEGFLKSPTSPTENYKSENQTPDSEHQFSETPFYLFENRTVNQKPELGWKYNISQELNNLPKTLNNKTIIGSDIYQKPVVDRKLKPLLQPSLKSLETSQNANNQNDKSSISQCLTKEEEVLQENIQVEKECLEKERQFEMLRLKKLYEHEEGMRLEIQKQEEELLARIKTLEMEAKEKDVKYQKLREENNLIMQELQKGKEEAEQLNKLHNMEEEKKELMAQVEKMREERKKKEKTEEAERRTKEKPDQMFEIKHHYKQKDTQPSVPDINLEDTEHKMPLREQTPGMNRKSSLSRSHSSPNIAQLVAAEEDSDHITSTPHIDRTLKPTRITESFSPTVNRSLKPEEIKAAQLRNLQPVYGNQGQAVTGLRNLGNTCFMNAVIQCLALTIPLSIYFTRGLYRTDINRGSKGSSKGEVTEEFAIVIRSMWNGVFRSLAPRDFKSIVSKYLSVCVGYEQQDSHEFLIVLLEKLHEDLNKAKVHNSQGIDLENLSETEAQQKFWQHHINLNESIISTSFEGLLQSTLTCLNCKKTSHSYEVFSVLSLPIPNNVKCSLKQCLELFLKAEIMTDDAAWDCPRCIHKQEAKKTTVVCRLPTILVIHLKRFSFEGLWRRKLQTFVDFPIELDMRPFIPGQKSSSYYLYGVVNHYGTLEGGHYIAFCKNSVYDKWYKYDDHEVSSMYENEVKTSAAYLLFYSCVDFQQYLRS